MARLRSRRSGTASWIIEPGPGDHHRSTSREHPISVSRKLWIYVKLPQLARFVLFSAANSKEASVIDLLKRPTFALFTLLALGASAGCTAADDNAQTGDEDDLTSVTARERAMAFDGYVYVSTTATDSEILAAVKRETKSAFGALRTAEISANTRELGNVDPASFVKEKVTVVDPMNPAAPTKSAMRVRFRYTDRALVPVSMAKRGAIGLAVMNGNYQAQSKRILEECTEKSKEDLEFESAIWYVFNPSLSQCRDAMESEQLAIETGSKGLADGQITKAEYERLYIPMTVKLESTKTTTAKTYPEYDQLWSGGVQPGKVVVSMVSGVMADWAAGEKPELYKDIGYHMFYQQMTEIQKVYPGLALVDVEGADLTSFTVNGKKVTGVTWTDLVNWELKGTGFPANITYSDRDALKKVVADTLSHHWLTFEQPVSVKIGSGETKDVTIQINTYYGAETDDAPHRRALSSSDVVVYNGHSYIGWGPLDPSRYSASSFPSSYQVLMFNSCVSFNYYEKDFFKMHPGGTAKLDMVTNGLESPVNGSGPSVGRFVANLLNGKQRTYKELLMAAANGAPATEVGMDALRVVDGEVDNTYKPTKKIVVSPK